MKQKYIILIGLVIFSSVLLLTITSKRVRPRSHLFTNVDLMENRLSCDVNRDSKCDLADIKVAEAGIGYCRGEIKFNTFADFDGNGCVTASDIGQLNNDILLVLDKHYCQTDVDCMLTGVDPDGFATCTNKKWNEVWETNPLSKNYIWECLLYGQEKCGCVNNKCQRLDASKKTCG